MAVAIRVLALLMLLALAGCFSTQSISSSGVSRANQKAVIYYVRSSDTLYSIGKKFGVDYHLIASRNYVGKPYKIYVGQQLYIDRYAPRSQPLPTTALRRLPTKKVVSKEAVKSSKKPAATTHQAKAGSYGKGKLLWPVKGKVTSRFGRRGSRMHDGIDISGEAGAPVHAAADGEVVYSDSRLSGYGKLVILRHGRNLFTAYAHNQRNLVKKGVRVKAGDVIARVGSTGRASGPHLHFEVRQGSTPVDPLAYLPRR